MLQNPVKKVVVVVIVLAVAFIVIVVADVYLVVMGGNSGSEGRGFESHHHKLDGYFFTYTYML